MSFIEDSLLPQEKIVYQANLSVLALIWPLFLSVGSCILLYLARESVALACLLVFIGLFAAANIIAILADYFSTEFGVTNMRVIAKTGAIRRDSVELRLNQIESVKVGQSIFGRIFNFGTITVTGSGGTSGKFPLISNPLELRKQVNNQIAQFGN